MPVEPALKISVIVISYNTRDVTLQCLRALAEHPARIECEVLLVDNGSQDGSAAAVRREFPQVRVIANESNFGFGAANNRAMSVALGKFLLLLNSDAFVQTGAIDALVEYLERHPRLAVAGPKLLNADDSLQISCFPFPSPLRAWVENLWLPKLLPHTARLGDYRKWAHDRERIVDWVVGACMLVRREAYEAVGGFDERFFMYSEEADWQRRMRDAGWEIGFTPAARVTHLGGASGAGAAPIDENFFDSLDRYELKHHGVAGFLLLRAAMAIGSTMRAIGWAVLWLLRPRRRSIASSKLKLHLHLVARQVTHLRIPGRSPGGPEQWGVA